jgi:RNA polymerase sigma-70 factor (ECF subfamily)
MTATTAQSDGCEAGASSSDEALVQRAADGSLAAFNELVGRYERRLLGFLLQRTGNRADAEDAMQEALVKAYRALGRYNSRWRFSTWLFTIAARELASLQRGRRPGLPLDDAAPMPAPPPAAQTPAGAWDAARRLLGAEHYAALWLCYGEDLSVAEIGRVLGRTRIWVRVSLFRSRRALRAVLDRDGAVKAGGEP